MQVAHYLALLHHAELDLAAAFRHVAEAQADEVDVYYTCHLLADQCDQHAARLAPFAERYGEQAPEAPDQLHAVLFHGPRTGGLGLLCDLHDLYLAASRCDIGWTLLGQAAHGLRDRDLRPTVEACEAETVLQVQWLKTRMKTAAPQALVVA